MTTDNTLPNKFVKPGTKIKCPQGCGKYHEIIQPSVKSISQYYYCGKPMYTYAIKGK